MWLFIFCELPKLEYHKNVRDGVANPVPLSVANSVLLSRIAGGKLYQRLDEFDTCQNSIISPAYIDAVLWQSTLTKPVKM